MVASVGVPTSHDLVFFWFAPRDHRVLGHRPAAPHVAARHRLVAVHRRPVHLRPPARLRGRAALPRARGAADQGRGGDLRASRSRPSGCSSTCGTAPTDLRWWDYATWFVYLTHFVATLIVAAILWRWAHDRFVRFATMVCVLALAGFATYVLYPAVPPWLAARHGAIGEANRTIAIVWQHVPIAHFGSLFEKGQHYANNVAAMPSLHAAYSLLIALYLWRLVPRWCAAAARALPARDGVLARLHRRALRRRLHRRLGLRGRRRSSRSTSSSNTARAASLRSSRRSPIERFPPESVTSVNATSSMPSARRSAARTGRSRCCAATISPRRS